MASDNASTIVTVTGASSFVAAPVIALLLKQGYNVRGTVRSIGSKSSAHVTIAKLAPGSESNGCSLTLFEADLLRDGSFDEAVAGAHYVMHMASPVALSTGIKDPRKRILEPAIRGVENVLNAVNKAGTVKRVILTSSISAVTQSPLDVPGGQHTFTEADWADVSDLKTLPYGVSKREAERKAWEMAKAPGVTWDMVALCPGLVFGRNYSGRDSDSSLSLLRKALVGEYRLFINVDVPVVDIDDTAEAHLAAMQKPEANGRYIVVGKSMSTRELMQILKANFPRHPNTSVWLPRGPAQPLACVLPIQTYLIRSMGLHWKIDASRLTRELGIAYRPMEPCIVRLCDDLIDAGIVKKRRGRVSGTPPAGVAVGGVGNPAASGNAPPK